MTRSSADPGSPQRVLVTGLMLDDMLDEPSRGSNGPSPMALSDPAAPGLSTPPLGWWTRAHWGLLLVALMLLVVAGQGQHFFYDEWAFLGGRLDAVPFPERYLLPHNEHWTMLPLLAYRTLRATFGVGSYWPYLGLLLLLHLAVTRILWRLMLVTGTKPLVATALAAVFSVLGGAAENLVWAFQIAFVGATLLGTSAVYLAVTGAMSWRRTAVVTCLTTAGLATSGVGLAYLIAVPLVLARRRRRHGVAVLAVTLLVYAAWYAAYGRSLSHPPEISASAPLMVGAFVTLGLVSALTKYFGFEMNAPLPYLVVGAPILAGIALACRDWIAERTLAGRTLLAMCAGAAAFFGAAGLARGGLGLGIAISPRYVYVAMALLLPGLAVVISRVGDHHPRLMRAVLPVAIAMAAGNALQLVTSATETRRDSNDSLRVLAAASDLARENSPIFAKQLPEPVHAPDLTMTDLGSGHLGAAFENVGSSPSERLTASLNLQIRIAPNPVKDPVPSCRVTREKRITVPAGSRSKPVFAVAAAGPVGFTLHDAGSRSTPRLIAFARGTYQISSLRDTGELTIESRSPSSLLARC